MITMHIQKQISDIPKSRDIYIAKYYGKGGGKLPAGEKNEIRSQGKNAKSERKKDENYIKKGGKGLKNASFWAIN